MLPKTRHSKVISERIYHRNKKSFQDDLNFKISLFKVCCLMLVIVRRDNS